MSRLYPPEAFLNLNIFEWIVGSINRLRRCQRDFVSYKLKKPRDSLFFHPNQRDGNLLGHDAIHSIKIGVPEQAAYVLPYKTS